MADDARDVLSFKREPRPFALPDVPQVSDPQLRAYLRALKEVVETRLIGGRGGLADRALTYRDALAAGLIEVIDGASVLRGAGTPVVGTAIPPGVVTDGPLDNITPSAPTGLQAAAALAGVLVQWDAPDPDRVAYTEVFSNGTNDLGTAVLIGTSQGRFYADAVGATGVTKYYWVRFVARGSQELRGPFNAVGGTAATTGRVGNADLTDLIVTAGKLADGAIDLTTNKVTANAQFGALAVGYTVTQYLVATSGVMQNLVVDNAQILSLDAGKINTGFLSADRVQLGSLDTKIAVITNAQIQSLDAGKVTTGLLSADRIGAQTITFNKLAGQTSVGNILTPDPGIEDLTAWQVFSGTPQRTLVSDAPFGRYVWAGDADNEYVQTVNIIPIDRSRVYRVLASARRVNAGDSRPAYLFVQFLDANGAHINGSDDPQGWPSAGTYHYFGVTGTVPPTAWTNYGLTFGAGQAAGIPVNARFARVGALVTYTGGAGANYVNGLRIVEVMPAELIVDGAVTSNKVSALEIAVGKYIRSSNYAAGSAGWNIDGAGAAEFQNVTVRGDVQASSLIANIVDAPNIVSSGASKFTTGSFNGGTTETGFALNLDWTTQALGYVADRVDSLYFLSGHLHLYFRFDPSSQDPIGTEYEPDFTFEVRPVLDGVAAANPVWYDRRRLRFVFQGGSGGGATVGSFRFTVPTILTWALSVSGSRQISFRVLASIVNTNAIYIGARGYSYALAITEFKRQRTEETQVTVPRVINPPVVTG